MVKTVGVSFVQSCVNMSPYSSEQREAIRKDNKLSTGVPGILCLGNRRDLKNMLLNNLIIFFTDELTYFFSFLLVTFNLSQ